MISASGSRAVSKPSYSDITPDIDSVEGDGTILPLPPALSGDHSYFPVKAGARAESFADATSPLIHPPSSLCDEPICKMFDVVAESNEEREADFINIKWSRYLDFSKHLEGTSTGLVVQVLYQHA